MVISTLAFSRLTPLALIINNSLLLSPLSYLKPRLKDLNLTLDPRSKLNVYLSLMSSKSKLLELERLYLNEGPAKTLIGPKILYPKIIGTWISVDLYECSAILIDWSNSEVPSIADAFLDFEKIRLNSGLM